MTHLFKNYLTSVAQLQVPLSVWLCLLAPSAALQQAQWEFSFNICIFIGYNPHIVATIASTIQSNVLTFLEMSSLMSLPFPSLPTFLSFSRVLLLVYTLLAPQLLLIGICRRWRPFVLLLIHSSHILALNLCTHLCWHHQFSSSRSHWSSTLPTFWFCHQRLGSSPRHPRMEAIPTSDGEWYILHLICKSNMLEADKCWMLYIQAL